MLSNRRIVIALLTALSTVILCCAIFIVSSQRTQAEKVVFTGSERHQISYAEGKKMIEGFLNTRIGDELIAGYMGRNIFEKILAQQECVGIRIYKAKLQDGASTFVLIGVNGSGKDMISGVVGEEIFSCPPWCDYDAVASATPLAQNEPIKR